MIDMDPAMQTTMNETASKALKSKDAAIKARGARIQALLATLPIVAGTPYRAKRQTRTERVIRQASFQIARFEAEDEAIAKLQKEVTEARESCNEATIALAAATESEAEKAQWDFDAQHARLQALETQLSGLLGACKARRGGKAA